MARSRTRSVMFGATTLIIAISPCATLFPTVSISYAAWSVSSRACSISMRMSDIGADGPLIGYRPAKCHAGSNPLAHGFQRALGHADTTHTVMDASRTKTSLRDFKSAAFSQQHVGGRHANVGVTNFRMAMGRVVVAKDRQQALNFNARRVRGHEDHRLLGMPRRGRIGLTHEDRDLAAWIAGARGPPLTPVDDVFVAFAANAGFNVSCVRRSDRGFGHGKT